jgi:hypothetical protein
MATASVDSIMDHKTAGSEVIAMAREKFCAQHLGAY